MLLQEQGLVWLLLMVQLVTEQVQVLMLQEVARNRDLVPSLERE